MGSTRLANLRDLGGLRTTSGGRILPGLLYRSDAPLAGDERPDAVMTWPPRTVVDLRSAGEADSQHSWPETVVVHRIPLLGEAGAVWRTAPAASRAPRLEELYERMLDAAPTWIGRLTRIVAHGNEPVLVHCTGGKDRTGVAIAALVLGAGVEPADVVADYTATAARIRRLLVRLDLPNTAIPPERFAPPEAIGGVVARLTGWPGGVSGWFVDHGASPDDVGRLARRLTQREQRSVSDA